MQGRLFKNIILQHDKNVKLYNKSYFNARYVGIRLLNIKLTKKQGRISSMYHFYLTTLLTINRTVHQSTQK